MGRNDAVACELGYRGSPRAYFVFRGKHRMSRKIPNFYYGDPKGYGADCYAFANKCARMIRNRATSD